MIDLDDIERIAKQGAPYGLNVDQLRRAVAWRDDKALALVARIREQEAQLAEAYQVVGALANLAGVFDHPDVIRALDMLSGMPIDGELSPFPREPWPADPMRADRDSQMERACIAEAQLAEVDALVTDAYVTSREAWGDDYAAYAAEEGVEPKILAADAAIARHRARGGE